MSWTSLTGGGRKNSRAGSPATVLPEAEDVEAATQRHAIVSTTRFGDLEIDQERVITMTAPFWGFPGSTRFFLQSHSGNSPLMWLQSIDDPALAFVVVPPAVIDREFKPPITGPVRKELGIDRDGDLDVLVILTVPAGRPREMTANLLAPVVINVRKRLAKQVLLDPVQYDPCWPVFG
ncbi:MAG: flagellar assembly protein FliW [Proteobacteria bacterium]|nr:flagellar assembly protein FliW [Pseudomonadota bacterium]MBU1737188.1 flagellar assembly protein FliW [Pseudomonadota bacterium]